MPLYDYQCLCCGHTFEQVRPIAEWNEIPDCPNCKSGNVGKIIVNGHGGIKDDHPAWMNHPEVIGGLVDTDDPVNRRKRPPTESRGYFNRYLKEKGIVQVG